MDDVLAAGRELVLGDRMGDYGEPDATLQRTAEMWSAYLGIPITIRMVASLNVLQKLARDRQVQKRDNLVDAAGYILLASGDLEKR